MKTFDWHFDASNQASSYGDVWFWKSEYPNSSLARAIFGGFILSKIWFMDQIIRFLNWTPLHNFETIDG